jgi:hypothetical protein
MEANGGGAIARAPVPLCFVGAHAAMQHPNPKRPKRKAGEPKPEEEQPAGKRATDNKEGDTKEEDTKEEDTKQDDNMHAAADVPLTVGYVLTSALLLSSPTDPPVQVKRRQNLFEKARCADLIEKLQFLSRGECVTGALTGPEMEFVEAILVHREPQAVEAAALRFLLQQPHGVQCSVMYV